MRNRILLLTIVLSVLSVFGCKKLAELTQFEIPFTASVVIPSSTVVDLPINIMTPEIETNSASIFKVNDTRKNLVKEIVLKSMALDVTSPSSGNLNFLESISIYMSAEGLDEVKIAWKEDVPADLKTLNLDVTGADLKEYIKADKFSLRMNIKTDELVTSEHHIDIHSVFFVDAKIFGK